MSRLPRFDPRDSLVWVREPERDTALRRWRLDVVSRRGWLVAGTGATLIFLAHLLGRHEMMAVGAALVALVFSCWAFIRFGRLVGNIHRRADDSSLKVGDVLSVELSSDEQAAFQESLPAEYGAAPVFQAPGSFAYEIIFRRRGIHILGPARQVLSDPCGLMDGLVSSGPPTGVTVRAEYEPVGSYKVLGGRVLTGDARYSRSTTADYYDVGTREYQQGDSVRQVHWKATARQGKLMVRQESYVATAHAFIILDRRQSAWHLPADMSYEIPQGNSPALPSTRRFETGLSLACSIGEVYARHGYQLLVQDLSGHDLQATAGHSPAGFSAQHSFEDFHEITSRLELVADPGAGLDQPFISMQLQKLLLGFADEPVFLVLGDINQDQAQWLAALSRSVRNVELFIISAHPERYRGLLTYFSNTLWRVHLSAANQPVSKIWDDS